MTTENLPSTPNLQVQMRLPGFKWDEAKLTKFAAVSRLETPVVITDNPQVKKDGGTVIHLYTSPFYERARSPFPNEFYDRDLNLQVREVLRKKLKEEKIRETKITLINDVHWAPAALLAYLDVFLGKNLFSSSPSELLGRSIATFVFGMLAVVAGMLAEERYSESGKSLNEFINPTKPLIDLAKGDLFLSTVGRNIVSYSSP